MPISQDNRPFLQRLSLLRIFMLVVFLGLGLRLWHLTIVRSDHFQELALRNQVRTVPLMAPRGPVFDREGRTLVENTYQFNLFLYRDQSESLERSTRFLVDRISVEPLQLQERLEDAVHYPDFQPVLVKEDLSLDEISRVLAHQSDYPEFRLLEQPRRLYRYGEQAAHVLGFVGEVSPAELEAEQFAAARAGDVVGKVGIERTFNTRLTGKEGVSRVLVNSWGRVLEEIERVEPKVGAPLQVTLDLDLQAIAEQALGDRPGAAVMMDVRTGEILVLASRPSFDPNLFATRISGTEWKSLIENPDNPLQNRVTQSTFSPGSIFKLIMAAAGLEEGLIDAATSIYCGGQVILYGHSFRCWKAGGHGRVRLHDAIQHSCNVYFYLLGQRLGIERIEKYGRMFGLGAPAGLNLQVEASGLVPSPEWKRRVSGAPWYAGETISVAIGQGPLTVTPLQLVRAAGLVATGNLVTPLLDGSRRPEEPVRAALTQEHLELIRQAMWSVVNDWGTGRGAQVEGFDVCGKTGTAQTISNRALEDLPEEERGRFTPNAWFVGFAPRDAPEVAAAVIVQRGGSGGSEAAPIAGRLFEEYYRKARQGETDENLRMAELRP